MKTGTKKLISLLISLAVILTALPLAGVTAFAATNDGILYEVESGKAYIVGYNGSSTTLNIPSEIDGFKVSGISYWAFTNNKVLENVTIPEGVTLISNDAFKNCVNLKSVVIPDTISIIASYAFSGCVSLTSVTIPSGSIDSDAFRECSNLTSIKLGKDIISIGKSAFYNTGYYNNPSNWKNGVLYIDDCLIDGHDEGLPENYTIREGTRVIADSAFLDCGDLTGITIPDSVTSIGADAFSYCESLTSIAIPNSVTNIGERAFEVCDNLTEIKVDASNKNYSSQDGVLFNKNKTELIQYPAGKSGASYDIPNGVTIIGNYAFRGCDSLTSVTIPAGVTSIGESAFEFCAGLTSVTIPDSVTSIGGYAFDETGYYDNDLNWENGVLYIGKFLLGANRDKIPENYTIKEGTRVIADGAFGGFDRLTSITIPDSVTIIGYSAFGSCSSLTNVTIPDSVTNIGDWAFSDCDSLTSITIPDSVTSIGYGAFSNTEYYDNPSNWENGVLYIDNCLIATNYEIPENYTVKEGTRVIADMAFWSENLTNITIPESVTNIGDWAFSDCSSLTDIYILNKDCNIVSSSEDYDTIPTETTIHGYAGSTAESYAKEHGNKFVVMEEPKIASGEVSGDGKLSTVDAKWILQNIAKSREFSDEQFRAADLNGDGKLSVVDVKWVLQIVAGMRNAETLELITK